MELPRPDDASFRITCNEIADQLSKSWSFKLQVIGIIIAAVIVIAAAASGIVGWNISTSIAKARLDFQQDAQKEIGKAREGLEAEIAEQFKKENVQKTMEQAASKEAAALLKKSVEPSINDFQQKLDKNGDDLDKRLAQFNELITKNEAKSSASVEILRTELTRLQKRNDLTALADKAIAEGDVGAYRRLESLLKNGSEGEEMNAVASELFRVFQAYSVFSGVRRTGAIELKVSEINPAKAKEEDLDIEDLLPLLNDSNPLVRVKVAELIYKKAKSGSFKTAEAIVSALERETHLEAFKVFDLVFQKITGREAGGKLDKRELFQWWEENKARLKKEDTDATPTPTPQNSASPAKH